MFQDRTNYPKINIKPSKQLIKKRKYPKLGKKFIPKDFGETETITTMSTLQCFQDKENDFYCSEEIMTRIQINQHIFEFDCSKISQILQCFAQLQTIGELRQKIVQIKIVVMDRICLMNPLMEGLMSEVCEEYSRMCQKKIFQ